ERRMPFRIGVHLGDVVEKPDGTVYGDGVNIAARLQGLAAPGSITVSDAVKAALRGRVPAVFDDQGEPQGKNIPGLARAYAAGPHEARCGLPAPVRPAVQTATALGRPTRRLIAAVAVGVALVIAGGTAAWLGPWRARTGPASPAAGPLALPAKPSIAVLPFDNL